MTELTLNDAALLTAGAAMWSSAAVASADIVSFTMSDGPMGIASGKVDERDIARLSPCATALGASWDGDLVSRIGALVGQEAVIRGIDAVLGPNLNLARSPLAGRAFEYFSEDPLLAGTMGAQWISGLQSTGTASVAKHLVCNDSETARDSVDVQIDERTLREVYLLPFEYAAEAGAAGMLAAYNRVNGNYCAEQHHILTDIVKGEWAYSGAIMSDWFGTHSTASTLNAGLDLEMPGPPRFLGPKSADAVRCGDVAEDRVRDAAARVSELARRATGAKSCPYADGEADALLVEAAAAGMVLLKNDGILPLKLMAGSTLAVIGPNAAAPCFQGGTFAKISVRSDLPTPIDAIRARYGKSCEVIYQPGVDPAPRLPFMTVEPARDLGDHARTGMTIDYFASSDCSGEPMTSETRDTNSLVWFAGMHDQADFAGAGSIRAAGRFTATKTGEHVFHLGATGQAHMSVDGHTIIKTSNISPGDTMGVLKTGDSETARHMLQAGQTIYITTEFPFAAARVHGLWYGIREPGSPQELLDAAEAAARAADTVILMVGETSDSSVESKDRPDAHLDAGQIELIRRVCAANPNTAIIANVGHAYDSSWEASAAAHVSAWYPGEGFAEALADVLTGKREPGGRLPVTFAASFNDYPGYHLQPDDDGKLVYNEATRFGYRGLIASGKSAAHSLGAGMGYARFAWGEPQLAQSGVLVEVANISECAGSDVIQIYRDAPETALIGFAKVHLAAGESARVHIPLTRRSLSIWDGGSWHAIAESLMVRIARHAEDEGSSLLIRPADLSKGQLFSQL